MASTALKARGHAPLRWKLWIESQAHSRRRKTPLPTSEPYSRSSQPGWAHPTFWVGRGCVAAALQTCLSPTAAAPLASEVSPLDASLIDTIAASELDWPPRRPPALHDPLPRLFFKATGPVQTGDFFCCLPEAGLAWSIILCPRYTSSPVHASTRHLADGRQQGALVGGLVPPPARPAHPPPAVPAAATAPLDPTARGPAPTPRDILAGHGQHFMDDRV